MSRGDWVADIRTACRAGLPLTLLREKDLSFDEFEPLASALFDVVRTHGSMFFINIGVGEAARERLDLAAELRIDGIHLPEGSLSVSEVRSRVGHEMALSRAIHPGKSHVSTDEMNAVVISPIYPPLGKDALSPIGPHGFREAVTQLDPNVGRVALGGITPENASDLMEVGANAIAVRSGLWNSDDVAGAVERYLAALHDIRSAR